MIEKLAPSTVVYLAEPPVSYLIRPPLVIDCSVFCAAIFNEETRLQAMQIMSGKKLNAPYLLDHEVVNVALKKARLGWPAHSVTAALADYMVQDIQMHETDVQAQHALAQQYGLSGYDAAYLWLAAVLKAPLATFDKKLAEAARAHLSSLP